MVPLKSLPMVGSIWPELQQLMRRVTNIGVSGAQLRSSHELLARLGRAGPADCPVVCSSAHEVAVVAV